MGFGDCVKVQLGSGHLPATHGPSNETPKKLLLLLRRLSKLNSLGFHPENADTQQATHRLYALREIFTCKLVCHKQGRGNDRSDSKFLFVDCFESTLSPWQITDIRCLAFVSP